MEVDYPEPEPEPVVEVATLGAEGSTTQESFPKTGLHQVHLR